MRINEEYIEEVERLQAVSENESPEMELVEAIPEAEKPIEADDWLPIEEEPVVPEGLEETPQEEEVSRRSEPRKWEIWLGSFFQGDVFDLSKLYYYWPLIAALILAFCVNITNNFVMISKKKKVSDMEALVEDLQHKQLAITNDLSRKSRALDVEERVRTLGLNLEVSETPPIHIFYDSTK